MKIEIWWDPVCPWCYLGKKNFEAAYDRFEHPDRISVTWRAFQLEPDASTEPGPTTVDVMAPYSSRESVLARFAQIAALGEEHGLAMNITTARPVNAFDAHRVALLAQDEGLFREFSGAVLHAYHTENRNIADHAVLRELAESAGLDGAKTAAVLDGSDYADQVESDRLRARRLGVGGVPSFVIDGQVLPSGPQSVDRLLAVLESAPAAS
ncbi:DsbA family oxidoreductase [Saccharopolyspora oryzae]|uniref:DsbA family oxidoreductase n=1 Tax=Saccharopolyspora oryzae TaxID=2997343 RepID=A0ABT4USV4_9PSEU|nr:DsbA family oxidoreductase [Saccharopolyspora oryzae]MDA3624739.1 DsbA family oxidoreductase [Saccharopolyspora oryzae]